MPYRKEILLDELEVDGTLHIDDILAKTEHLSVGDAVVLKRDLTRKENPLAVSVENPAGECIGALPKKFSAPYARLLDAGKLLVAKVATKELDGHWLNLATRVTPDSSVSPAVPPKPIRTSPASKRPTPKPARR